MASVFAVKPLMAQGVGSNLTKQGATASQRLPASAPVCSPASAFRLPAGRGMAAGRRIARSAPAAASQGLEAVKGEHMLVADVMTEGAIVCARPHTTVDEALELLVDGRVTGLPVVDDDNIVVGVVSDYDLLALDSISNVQQGATRDSGGGMFPPPEQSWGAFQELQKLLEKTAGTLVEDVMTPEPMVVRPFTNVEDASRLLLAKKFRRLPVVDGEGKLVGILTRGNVVRAALAQRRAAKDAKAN